MDLLMLQTTTTTSRMVPEYLLAHAELRSCIQRNNFEATLESIIDRMVTGNSSRQDDAWLLELLSEHQRDTRDHYKWLSDQRNQVDAGSGPSCSDSVRKDGCCVSFGGGGNLESLPPLIETEGPE